MSDQRTHPSADAAAFNRIVWFNTVILALTFGTACGALILVATYLSIALTGAEAGMYLNLLGVFFPGYSATPLGAWAGFFWGFMFAGLSGGLVYQIYSRSAGRDWAKSVTIDAAAPHAPLPLTLLLSGRALGLAIGAILAIQLVVSTAWLVLRGTADESVHAALLSHYLPGYSVSLPGALIGGIWLFAYGFAFSFLFANVYNFLVKQRQAGSRADAR
ncbi:MAG: hypothetical protein NW203_14055 [Hyphomonadaceae bacterium]|nr:hypothetical protein [Hyphomonadaceae bacterium]